MQCSKLQGIKVYCKLYKAELKFQQSNEAMADIPSNYYSK